MQNLTLQHQSGLRFYLVNTLRNHANWKPLKIPTWFEKGLRRSSEDVMPSTSSNFEDTDLIWEGITTIIFTALSEAETIEDTDLIWEGITTFHAVPSVRYFINIEDTDLIWEGITT